MDRRPLFVDTDDGTFSPGSLLYFRSDRARANPFGDEAVYELEIAEGGERMPVVEASPFGDSLHSDREATEHESERLYMPALTKAPDRWLWELILAPDRKGFLFDVNALATDWGPSDGEAGLGLELEIEIHLQGGSDLEADPTSGRMRTSSTRRRFEISRRSRTNRSYSR